MRILLGVLASSFFILPLSVTQAEPHTHAGRTHSHPFPAQLGVRHKHGAGEAGKYAGKSQPAPRTTAAPARATSNSATPRQGRQGDANSY